MRRQRDGFRFFALSGSKQLGTAVARWGGFSVAEHEERAFEDGEFKLRPRATVRGSDVFVLLSLAGGDDGSPSDKLCRLLFFIAGCKENGAARVTAVVPYLAYMRKDRQTKARDPVTTRYVAQLFEAVGTDRIVTLDVHSLPAFQNAFRIETIHLDSRKLFSSIVGELAEDLPVAIVSPDGGGVKRAQLLKEKVEAEFDRVAGFAFLEKRRSRGHVSGDLFAGDVHGAATFILDDMISTGGTLKRASDACRERGASKVYALATHGLLGPKSTQLFDRDGPDQMIVTDSVANATVFAAANPELPLRVVSVAPLLADAINHLHTGGSITDIVGLEN